MSNKFSVSRCCSTCSYQICRCCKKSIASIRLDSLTGDGPYYNPVYWYEGGGVPRTDLSPIAKVDLNQYNTFLNGTRFLTGYSSNGFEHPRFYVDTYTSTDIYSARWQSYGFQGVGQGTGVPLTQCSYGYVSPRFNESFGDSTYSSKTFVDIGIYRYVDSNPPYSRDLNTYVPPYFYCTYKFGYVFYIAENPKIYKYTHSNLGLVDSELVWEGTGCYMLANLYIKSFIFSEQIFIVTPPFTTPPVYHIIGGTYGATSCSILYTPQRIENGNCPTTFNNGVLDTIQKSYSIFSNSAWLGFNTAYPENEDLNPLSLSVPSLEITYNV